tara:strand:- start:2880 stop:4223 length:1344 start_codon:yes stop_codon:yes gene_type:complete
MARLNQKDSDLLNTNQVIDLSSQKYAYLGGEFGSNSNDYVEVLVYSGENFLESGVVDSSDYENRGQDGIKIKTGTILRKMGYDRGKFNVKFNFFRKTAGSNETLLVDSAGKVYRGEFHTMSDGSIMSGAQHSDASYPLFLKENKYPIQEISPSRNEVRLISQNIKDNEYKDNFNDSQLIRKKVQINNDAEFISDGDSTKRNSLRMKLSGLTSRFKNVQSLVGGYVYLPNSYIERFLPPPPAADGTTGAEIGGEVESEIVQANFIISDESQATRRRGDTSFKKIFDIFKDGYPTEEFLREKGYDGDYGAMLGQVIGHQEGKGNVNVIRKLNENTMDVPAYGKGDIITLKSVSSKPNTSTTYTWTFYGYDWNSDGKWEKFTNNNNKIAIQNPPATGLQVIDRDKTNGSEVTIALQAFNSRVGVSLKIDTKNETSTVSLPACIEVVGAGD